MAQKILIVDDTKINRNILKKILADDYDIAEAENGKEALSILLEEQNDIKAVIIDLQMPVMDGYDFLKMRANNPILKAIPVIVATADDTVESKVKALRIGASDYITKPYNPEIIRHCLKNNILVAQSVATGKVAKYDRLTDILSRDYFIEKANELIHTHPDNSYIMMCSDIDGFKIINELFGSDEGDRILITIANNFKQTADKMGGICGRAANDTFVALYPNNPTAISLFNKQKITNYLPDDFKSIISISIGKFVINDSKLTANAAFDRALIAKQSVKGKYNSHVATFDNEMLENLKKRNWISADMKKALAENQFEVWYQPQYNHINGKIVGAEALVRWRHPQFGIVSPADFIPIFEQNGFIYELDKYVWEEVCKIQKERILRKRKTLPISVNISRHDAIQPNLATTIYSLIEKYDIPTDLLRLEITESAFAQSPEIIVSLVKELVKKGFTVEIDDFGSGYSSLNTLKDVPAQTLKLDMKFMSGGFDTERSGSIIESVVRMAKWINMNVIAEGVETKEQADYLLSIGCYLIQGYFYAKPMPKDQLIKLVDSTNYQQTANPIKPIENYNNTEFWNPKSIETMVFNHYSGGAFIFEAYNGNYEMLRINNEFQKTFKTDLSIDEIISLPLFKTLGDIEKRTVESLIDKATKTGNAQTCEIYTNRYAKGKNGEFIQLTIRQIASTEKRRLFYGYVSNTTAKHISEKKEHEANDRLKTIIDNISSGVTVSKIVNDRPELITGNEQFLKIFEYSKEELEKGSINPAERIFKEDIAINKEKILKSRKDSSFVTVIYRIKNKIGKTIWLQFNITHTAMPDIDGIVELCVISDITELIVARENERIAKQKQEEISSKLYAIMHNVNSGISAVKFDEKGEMEYSFTNDKFYGILGYTREESEKYHIHMMSRIVPDDIQKTKDYFQKCKNKKGACPSIEYRAFKKDGSIIYLRRSSSITSIEGIGDNVILSVINDITQEKKTTSTLTFLNSTLKQLLSCPDENEAINSTIEKILEYFGAKKVCIFEFGANKNISTYGACADGNDAIGIKLYKPEYWLQKFSKNNYKSLSLMNDLDADDKDLELLNKLSVNSIIALPIMKENNLAGFLSISDAQANQSELSKISSIGSYIGIMLTRKELIKKVSHEEQALSAIVDGIPGGFVRMKLIDDKFFPVYYSEGYKKLLHYTDEQISIMVDDLFFGIHPNDKEIAINAYNDVKDGKDVNNVKFRLRSGIGGYIWVSMFGKIHYYENNDTFLNLYFTDATEDVKHTKNQTALLDNIPCGAALFNYDGKDITAIHINNYFWTLVEREVYDYKNYDILNSVYPDDRQIIIEEVNVAIRENRLFSANIRILQSQSDYKPYKIMGKIIRAEDSCYNIFASFMPIDGDMPNQVALPIMLSSIMQYSTDFTFIKNTDLRYISCSKSCADFLGLESPQQIIGKTSKEFFNTEETMDFENDDIQIFKTGEPIINKNNRLTAPDGKIRYGKISKFPIKDANGKVIAIYYINHDDSELADAHNELNALLQIVPGGVTKYSADENTQFDYISFNFIENLGYTNKSFKEKFNNSFNEMIYTEDRQRALEHIKAEDDEGTIGKFDYRVQAADGSLHWIHNEGVKVTDKNSLQWYYVSLTDITDYYNVQQQLKMSEEEYSLAVEHSGASITRYNIDSRTLYLPKNTVEKWNLPAIIYNTPTTQIESGDISDDSKADFIEFYDKILLGEKSGVCRYQRKLNGSWKWLEGKFTNIFNDSGKPVSAIISFSDITAQNKKELIYKKWEQSIVSRADESYSMFCFNLNKNSAFDSLKGSLIPKEYLNNTNLTLEETMEKYAFRFVLEKDRENFLKSIDLGVLIANYYKGNRFYSFEFREIMPNGNYRWLRRTTELVEYPSSNDIMAYFMFVDIDEAKREEIKRKTLAEGDSLTGVLNRKTFETKVTEILNDMPKYHNYGLIMLDIDEFKQINDRFGHNIGDDALIAVASILKKAVRRDDLIARLGGDEFMLFLKDIPNVELIKRKAGEICAVIQKQKRDTVSLSASIGIVTAPKDGKTFGELYLKADKAMYFSKRTGKNRYTVYSDDME